MRRNLIPTLSFVLCILSSGCATYQPRPFTQEQYYQEWIQQSVQNMAISEQIAEVHFSGATPDYSLSDGLTLDVAEVVALGYNPHLVARRKQAEILDASSRYAGLWDDPVLGFELRRILENVEDLWLGGLTMSWSLPVSGRLALQKDVMSSEAYAGWVQVAIQESLIRSEVRKSWLKWSTHRIEKELLKSYLNELDNVGSIATLLAEAGEISRPQAHLISIEQIEVEHELHHLETLMELEESNLSSLLGLPSLDSIKMIPAMHIPFSIGWNSGWQDGVFEKNLQLQYQAIRYEIAEKQLRLDVRKQYPDIQFGPIGEIEEGEPRLGFGIQVPLPILNGNARGIAEAYASREAERALWKASIQDVMGRIERLRITLAEAQERYAHLSDRLVPLVDQQRKDMYRLAELGEFNVLLFVEALQQHHETSLEVVNAQRDINLARIELIPLLEPDSLLLLKTKE